MSKPFENTFANRPRESLMAAVFILFAAWHVIIGGIGVVLYGTLVKYFNLNIVWIFCFGMAVILLGTALGFLFPHKYLSAPEYFHYGFKLHFLFWKHVFFNGWFDGLHFLFMTQLDYAIGAGFCCASVLGWVDQANFDPFAKELMSIRQRKQGKADMVSPKKLQEKMDSFKEEGHDGTPLGISKTTGQYVVVPDHAINEIMLVLGTTGGGKTITMRRFYQRAIMTGKPLIIIDGKPDEENVSWIMALAKKHGRPFYGFNCGNYDHYNALAHGGFTELKDKIICLKDSWTSDHYKSLAEDYVQTAFKVFLRSEQKFDLKTVARCLDFMELAKLAKSTKDPGLIDEVKQLEKYKESDLTGICAHLNILANSEMGHYFSHEKTPFTLPAAIDENAVVYFALPALRFPGFSKVLGALVINDLKTVIDRKAKGSDKVFAVFDEFSVFAGDHSLNLVNMGRGKGLHAIFGTQGLADLEKEDPTLKRQIMNCVNTLICHRLNDHESAEEISNWIGTKDAFSLTAQLNLNESGSNMGSIRKGKEFIVHPDAIKQELATGDVFYISKVGGFKIDRVVVKYS